MNQTTVILLAGGRSRRMGQEKADLLLQGCTLLERQAQKAEALGAGEILVSGYRGRRCRWPVVPDAWPDCGPLGGLASTLAAAALPICVVLCVDAPLVPPALLAALAEALRQDPQAEAVLARCGGLSQPLIAAYRTALAPRMAQSLAAGPIPVRRFLDSCRVRYLDLPPEQAVLLQNINDPSALRALRTALGEEA